MAPFASRRERLRHAARDEGLDALLVTSPVNVTYLTGFSGDSSHLILTAGKTLLVSDGRYSEQIAGECPDLDVFIRPTNQLLHEAVAAQANGLGIRALGFEANHLTVAEFQALSDLAKTVDWKPGKDRVERLRQVKDASEIAQIRNAIRIAERAFTMLRAMLRPSDTEKDLADDLEHYLRRVGARGSAFPIIAAFGPRAALPHAQPGFQRVDEAALLLVDWGASGPFYRSDLTRVLWRRDAITASDLDRLTGVYSTVLEAQRRAIGTIRAGVSARDVDAAARGCIAEAGFGEFFNHGSGHGFGLQIHEAPFLRPNSDAVLQAGMVITVEPGIYLPGWGGVRIEDDVLVTEGGAEVLTSYPRDFEASAVEF